MKQKLPIIGLGVAVALLLCLFRMPYGYYIFIRWLTMIYFVCVAFVYGKEQLPITITATSLAILFQPFFKIALGRTAWNVVDVIVAVALVAFWILNKRFYKNI